LHESTLYALPTYLGEGMPVALLEAMGAGKPLLTAKAGAIQHIIREPENGIVLDSVSVDSVEAALRALLNDPAYCKETGKRNEAYAWQRFEAKHVTAEIEALYRRIAQGR
jgi:glycosyltransferase involved in cell wall biosynthesis